MSTARAISLRFLATATIVALLAPIVIAAPTGPSYPPAGGVTLSASGNSGKTGGLTWSYSNIDMNRFNGIWWGAWNGTALRFAMDGAIDEASETMVYDATSDLSNGSMRWTGATDLRHLVSGSYITENLPTRITVRGLTPTNASIAFVTPTSVGLNSNLGAVLPVAASYKVNVLIEANRGGTWTPAVTLYDSLEADPACVNCTRTSISFGFYTDLNQPPVAAFGWSPAQPVERREITLTSSSSDPEGRPITQAWDLDNDGAYDDATGAAASVTFQQPGTYRIGLRVTDDRGLAATVSRDITVEDCSRGPVSDALRNTVYPAVRDVAEETAYYLACDVAADQLGL